MTTDTGRARRLLIGFVIGMLLVGGWQVYNRGGVTYNSGANLGKIDKEARTFGEPRLTPYPSAQQRRQQRRDRSVTFSVRQAGTTQRINVVSSVNVNPKKDVAKRVATWKRNTTAHSGDHLALAAEIVSNDQTNAGAGPLECAIVIDGLVYRSHFEFNPYGTGQMTCQASAVVP